MAHGHGPVGAVEVVVKVGVVLQTAEVGQAVHVAPAVVAEGLPGVVVLGRAADEGLAVDGAGTAQHAAARHGHGFGLLGRADAGEGPVEGRTGGAGLQVHGAPAQLEHLGQVVEVGIVGPGLKEQDGAVRVLGEAGGDDAAGRAAADNDVVVFHGNRSLRGWVGWGIVHAVGKPFGKRENNVSIPAAPMNLLITPTLRHGGPR